MIEPVVYICECAVAIGYLCVRLSHYSVHDQTVQHIQMSFAPSDPIERC